MAYLTYNVGILKKAEVITGIIGCTSFYGEDSQGFYNYSETLNGLAGIQIVLIESNELNYDYQTLGMVNQGVRTEWLDSLSTQVYWDQVPIDTEIEVSTDNVNWIKRHFSRYDNSSPDDKPYYAFIEGKTSYTISNLQEIIDIECNSSSAASLAGRYFFIYSNTDAYYIWFDVDNSETDPNPTSPGGQTLTEIEVNLNAGDTDSVIATKLKTAIEAQSDFSASLQSNTKVVVTIDSSGFTYDALEGNSGLSIVVSIQGGEEENFQYARLYTA